MIFDTHSHYNLEPFVSDWRTYWTKAQAEGVSQSVVVGTDLHSNTAATEIAAQESHLFAAIGYHPGEYQRSVEETFTRLKTQFQTETQLLKAVWDEVEQDLQTDIEELHLILGKKVVAIGETGLDYFRLPEGPTADVIKKAQQLAFRQHISIAQEHQLPLIIHVRDRAEAAYWDVLQILKENQFSGQFILHCISGPMTYVQEAVALGAYIGVAGNITYKNSEHLRDLVRSVPKNKVVTETDAPFLPPQAFRGKTCEPWMVKLTAEYLSTELNFNHSQLLENAQAVFNLAL